MKHISYGDLFIIEKSLCDACDKSHQEYSIYKEAFHILNRELRKAQKRNEKIEKRANRISSNKKIYNNLQTLSSYLQLDCKDVPEGSIDTILSLKENYYQKVNKDIIK